MPRRKPSSPTAAPTYAESWLPAASTSTTSPADAVEPDGDEHDRADVAERRTPPRRALCQSGRDPACRGRPGRTSAPTRRAARDQAVAVAGDAHLLARRGGGGRARTGGGPAGSCGAARSSSARSTPGRQVAVRTVGSAKTSQQDQRRVDRAPAAPSTMPSRRIQPQRGEQRHEQVVEDEGGAQHREPVEVLAAAPGARWSRPLRAAGRRAPPSRCVTRSRNRAARGRRRPAQIPHAAVAETARPSAATSTQPAVVVGDAVDEHASHSADQRLRAARRAGSGTSETTQQPRLDAVGQLASSATATRAPAAGRRPLERRGRHGRPPPRARRPRREPRGLQVEHRAVAAAERHQLVVGARARPPGRARARRSGRPAGRWRTGGRSGSSCSRGWRPGCGRRSRPRRGRRAARSARRAARHRRPAVRRQARARAPPAATARRRGRCRRRSRGPGWCRGRPGPRAPAARSADSTTSSGAPRGATLSRSGSS